MSKAEDRASELHILMWDADFYNGFIKGYDQAEKDLELSWEDMMRIDEIITQVFKESKTCQMEAIYQEVLKRFKERRIV
jgi:hypothetical protein